MLVPLFGVRADNISENILAAYSKLGLNMDKCIRQAYDRARAMSGDISGVNVRISKVFLKIKYVHCAGH